MRPRQPCKRYVEEQSCPVPTLGGAATSRISVDTEWKSLIEDLVLSMFLAADFSCLGDQSRRRIASDRIPPQCYRVP